MLNGKQFSRKFAEDCGYTYQAAEQICRQLFGFLGKTLYEDGEDITISRFGAFKHRKAQPKNVRHPGTGEIITQPARYFVKFTPSELLGTKED